MSAHPIAPVIIKRKKIIQAGHHGGAWKVAYADFVTAMMAFFLLMWLLGATNEKQRKGIADYFNPTIPVNKISGGGDGAFGGDSVFTENTLSRNGKGTGSTLSSDIDEAKSESGSETIEELARDTATFEELQQLLSAKAGESMVTDLLMRHIVTRLSDEGLIVEVFDIPGAPLFVDDAIPTDTLGRVLDVVAEVFRLAPNPIATQGHIASVPVVRRENPVWENSTARADEVRKQLVVAGLEPERMQRVTGFADTRPVSGNPLSERNNRIEIILLRSRR